MKPVVSFCKSLKGSLKLIALVLIIFPALLGAQINKIPGHTSFIRQMDARGNSYTSGKTTATTCPTGPIVMAGQDTLGNAITNGQTLACGAIPFYILPSAAAATTPNAPCIQTVFTNFHNNLATNGTETIYEGSTNAACVGPSATCFFPIGGGAGIPGTPWSFSLYILDPNQPHEFVFCRAGNITTTTVTLVDCWSGAALPSNPASTVFSNATTTVTPQRCDTLKLPANADIGTTLFSIAPASASVALTDLNNGAAYINTDTLPAGTYTVGYSFTPSVSSGCPTITGTFTFTIGPPITVAVNSPTICIGSTTTLTANGATTYTWVPSSGLSATTGSTVAANPTVTTTYTVTGMRGACTSMATSTVTVSSFTVNKATICTGNIATLIASDSTFNYVWTPATGLNTTTNDTVKANPPSTTVYTITGSNTFCPLLTITDSVIVKISPTITVFSPTVCSGTTATITATGATSYTWSPLTSLSNSVTNDTVYMNNPTTNTSYTVFGTAANACTDSAVSNVIISNHLGILSGTPVFICYGNPAWLSAIGASTYTWTSNDPVNLDFGLDTGYVVTSSVANVGTYTIAIYGESHSGTYCNGWDTVHLTVNPTPTVTAVPINSYTTVCSGTSTTFTVGAIGAVGINYSWAPGTGLSATTGSVVAANPTVTTTYIATGTNAGGCSDTAKFTVNIIPIPSFTVNSTAICLGNSDSLKVVPTTTVSGAQTYVWSPATGLNATTGTAVAANPNTPGSNIYTVTGTNSLNGVSCSSIATSTVLVIATPTITATANPNAICMGSTATLTAVGNAISYTWSPVTTPITGSVVTVSPTVTTIYTVTGTNASGCISSTATTLTVNPVPSFSINNTNPAFCKGDSSKLIIIPTGTPTVSATYNWAPATGLNATTGTLVTATPVVNTTYTVIATATTGGCQLPHITTVTVHTLSPLAITPSATTICNGNSTTLSTSNSLTVYTWTPTASISGSANTATVVANPTSTTVYSVSGQDAFGCHSDTATATVTVITIPATASSNSPVCKGQTINLSANSVSGTPTYSWTASNGFSSSSQNPIIPNATGTNSATYSLTIKDGACQSAVSIITVIVNNPPVVSVAPGSFTVCPGIAANYTASGASTYSWSPSTGLSSTTGSVVSASSSTTNSYSVIGTDVNNCSATATFTLHVATISANFISTPQAGDAPLNVHFTNNSVSGTTANTYLWNYGNGSTHITTSATDTSTHTNYPHAGIYTVTLVAENSIGCISIDTAIIIVTDAYTIVIPNVFTPNGDGINDNYIVKSEGVTAMSMLIYDRWGLKMFESSTINAPWDGKNTGGKEASEGSYFYLINVTSNKGVNREYKGFLTLIK